MSTADQELVNDSARLRKSRKICDLFIHIGSPKTGTTALQHFLHEKRDALLSLGVLYPRGGSHRSAHHVLGAAVFPGRASRLEGQTRDEALKTSVDAIREEINTFKPHTVVLSTEYLWGDLSPANVRRLLTPFNDCRIHIVIYVRRQDLLAQSLYVQAVKGGEARPFADWLAQAREGSKAGFHFDQVMSAWSDSGVNTRIIVRVYEKGQLASDIREDFLQTVAPGLTIALPEDRITNTSPDITTIELLRAVSAGVPDKDKANNIRRRLIAKSPPRTLFEPLTYFGPGEAAAFVEEFAESNATVARRYLGREDGVLFRDPPPGDGGETPPWPDSKAILSRLIAILPDITEPAPPPKQKARAKGARTPDGSPAKT